MPVQRQKDKHRAEIDKIFGHLTYLMEEQKQKMAMQRRRLANLLNPFVTQPKAKI
jgi:hypothetical protein